MIICFIFHGDRNGLQKSHVMSDLIGLTYLYFLITGEHYEKLDKLNLNLLAYQEFKPYLFKFDRYQELKIIIFKLRIFMINNIIYW